MKNEALRIYIKRKTGFGQSFLYLLRSYLPSFLIVFITSILILSLIFVFSMSKAIESTLVYLGSGHLSTREDVSSILPNSLVYEVKNATGLVASQDSKTVVTIKGVDDDYFFTQKREMINLELVDNTTSLSSIILSREIARRLNVDLSSRVSLLLYDEKEGRTRPIFCFVRGLYSSGYREFDEYLIFTSSSVTTSDSIYEVYSSSQKDDMRVLDLNNIHYDTYQALYRSLYDNINLSVTMLNAIVILVGILAGFFSISISSEYVERDRRDIAGILLLGFKKKDIIYSYRRITLNVVSLALAIGTIIGLVFSYLFIPLLKELDVVKYPFLTNYVLDFKIQIPYLTILILVLSLLFSSYISLKIALNRTVFIDIKAAI